MASDKIRKYACLWILILLLGVYLSAVAVTNFSRIPEQYNTDMYADICYAAEVWEQKSLFPEGWVFGNQLYAVATPVVAALMCGLVQNPCVAMSLASTLMTAGVLLSFDWMLRPVFRSASARLAACVAFLALVLFYGDVWKEPNGWQLLFTMCSYYACYAITAFCAFGCFLRKEEHWSRRMYGMLAVTCLLSFGTGIQSLRQTVIMTCPLVAVECLQALIRLVKKQRLFRPSLWISGSIAASNLAGVLVGKLVPVSQVEIFGSVSLQPFAQIPSRLLPSLYHATALFASDHSLTQSLLKLLFVAALVLILLRRDFSENNKELTCLLLFLVGIAALLVIHVFTVMEIRSIYYFMVYPLAAFLLAVCFSRGRAGQWGITLLLCLLFLFNWNDHLAGAFRQPEEPSPYVAVSGYLQEQGITTVYSQWDRGEKVAVASDCRIRAGFWNAAPFIRTGFLCNPDVFLSEPEACAYLFVGAEPAAEGEAYARQAGQELRLLQYFPEGDIYLYVSDVNLMN